MFVLTSLDALTGSHYTAGDNLVGLIVPPALLLWGFVLPRIGRLFAGADESILLQFVQETLAARIEAPGNIG